MIRFLWLIRLRKLLSEFEVKSLGAPPRVFRLVNIDFGIDIIPCLCSKMRSQAARKCQELGSSYGPKTYMYPSRNKLRNSTPLFRPGRSY